MSLKRKISVAEMLIFQSLQDYSRPMVMSSFGKDSMVLLEILKRMGIKLPILFHREPFSPKKYSFANQIIEANDYVVYDYNPLAVALTEHDGTMELVNHYQVGAGYSYVPTGILPSKPGEEFLCGYRDLYLKPLGTFEFPWNLAFMGHKSSDIDPILGPIPLRVDIRKNENACDYAYPLRHFADADIWEYHEQFNVPVNGKRYDRANGYKEFSDVTFNNDYHHACMLCIDRTQGDEVFCPKDQQLIPNISSTVKYVEIGLPEYIGT